MMKTVGSKDIRVDAAWYRNEYQSIHSKGIPKLWREVIKQAVSDLSTKTYSLGAYNWLFGPLSETAFLCCGLCSKDFRNNLRVRIERGTIVVKHLTPTS